MPVVAERRVLCTVVTPSRAGDNQPITSQFAVDSVSITMVEIEVPVDCVRVEINPLLPERSEMSVYAEVPA